MPHRRWLTLVGIALLAPVGGCTTDGPSGDPGAAFSGHGSYPTHGGSGYAGTSGRAGGNGHAGGSGGELVDASTTPTDAGASGDADASSSACVAGATSTFSLAWSLEDATGAVSTCDGVGGKTVEVDVVNLTTGAEARATTSCAALALTTCGMSAGKYSLSLALRDATGAVLSEAFAPTLFLVAGQDTGVASLPLQVGGDATKGRGFALTWSIDKVDTHAIVSCAQAGATTVRIHAGATPFDLTCTDGKGRTTVIAPGTYQVSLELLDGTGATLSATQTMSVAIGAARLVFLGDVPFDVD